MNFPREWMSEREALMKCSRKLTKMNFRAFWVENEDSAMIDTIRVISQDVEFLVLHDVHFCGIKIFSEFLGCFPKIKKLSLNVNTSNGDNTSYPELTLKTLIWQFTSFELLNELNLQSQKIIANIESHEFWENRINFNDIGNFLANQDLNTLRLKCYDGCDRQKLFRCLSSKMKQTTTFRELSVILEADMFYDATWDSFIEFLDHMKNSLRCLQIKFRSLPSAVFDKIINDMQLTKLNIEAEYFPDTLNFNHPNHHLKILTTKHVLPDLFGNLLMSAFPNIEYFSDQGSYESENLMTMEKIASNLKSLKFLRLPWYIEYNPGVCIPSLFVLSISINSENLDNICSFLNGCTSIETLLIETCDFIRVVNHQVLDQITQNTKNLKKLVICQDEFDVVNIEMLQMLSANCPKLESMKVETRNVPKHQIDNKCGRIHVTYHSNYYSYIPWIIFNQDKAMRMR